MGLFRWIDIFYFSFIEKNKSLCEKYYATVDCLEGQFDYIKNGAVIAHNINRVQDQQVTVGLSFKDKPTLFYAVYTYAGVSITVELELVNKNTLKWTINGDPNEGLRNSKTFKPREVLVPRKLLLKRFL